RAGGGVAAAFGGSLARRAEWPATALLGARAVAPTAVAVDLARGLDRQAATRAPSRGRHLAPARDVLAALGGARARRARSAARGRRRRRGRRGEHAQGGGRARGVVGRPARRRGGERDLQGLASVARRRLPAERPG